MIRWPGHAKPEKSDSLALSLDLVPTLLAAANLKPTPQMPGINLLDEQAVANRKELFGECFTHNSKDLDKPAASVRYRWMISQERDGNWKLIVPDPKNEPKQTVELYNLTDDPFEQRNLADKEVGRVESMRRTIDAWWAADK
jgi:uncharacterized sulfatase